MSLVLALLASSLAPQGFVDGDQSVGGGAVVHYAKGGKGEPVVLVHGFGETARMWRPIMPTLAKAYTVIVPDLDRKSVV